MVSNFSFLTMAIIFTYETALPVKPEMSRKLQHFGTVFRLMAQFFVRCLYVLISSLKSRLIFRITLYSTRHFAILFLPFLPFCLTLWVSFLSLCLLCTINLKQKLPQEEERMRKWQILQVTVLKMTKDIV